MPRTPKPARRSTISPEQSRAAGQDAAGRAEQHAALSMPTFSLRARTHVLTVLAGRGDASGEELTDSCKAAGVVPPDDRAFGSVYAWLARTGQIRCVGMVSRAKGHGTSGGRVWRLVR